MRNTPRQAGVVLISVLAVTAIIAAIAWQMVSRQSLVVASAGSAGFAIQSQEYLIGVEQYVRQLLFEDWEDEETRLFDSETEDWAATRPPFEVPGGSIAMRVWDMQSRFNLNAVDTRPEVFQTLLINHKMPAEIGTEWLDWIDEDDELREHGAEDMELLLLAPALRSPNALAAHESELRFLPAMFDAYNEDFEALLVALPTTTLKINVNTVTPELLVALGHEPAIAEAITEGEREYESVDDVNLLEAGEGSDYFVVTSDYFAVWAEVEIGNQRARLESYLYRHPEKGSVHLLGRNLESV